MKEWIVKGIVDYIVKAETKREAEEEGERLFCHDMENGGFFGITDIMSFEAVPIKGAK